MSSQKSRGEDNRFYMIHLYHGDRLLTQTIVDESHFRSMTSEELRDEVERTITEMILSNRDAMVVRGILPAP